MLNSPLENPLSFFGARTLRTAPRVLLLKSALRHCALRARAARTRGFLGGLERLRSLPLNRFLGIVLLRLKRMIRPATAVAILK